MSSQADPSRAHLRHWRVKVPADHWPSNAVTASPANGWPRMAGRATVQGRSELHVTSKLGHPVPAMLVWKTVSSCLPGGTTTEYATSAALLGPAPMSPT